MNFLIEDDDLLKKYNTVWDKVSADIKKEFDSEPVYNKKSMKTKIKSNGDEATYFHDKKMSKASPNHACLAVIATDSILKKDKSYSSQVLLKECKYVEKETRHITQDLEISSGDTDKVVLVILIKSFATQTRKKGMVYFWELFFQFQLKKHKLPTWNKVCTYNSNTVFPLISASGAY